LSGSGPSISRIVKLTDQGVLLGANFIQMHGHIAVKNSLARTGLFIMSKIRNAFLNWADIPGIEIQELTDSRININSHWGSATLTLKDDTYEVESASKRLKDKIKEIIERALVEEKATWLRGREWHDWLRGL
jgi:hypothetical protein